MQFEEAVDTVQLAKSRELQDEWFLGEEVGEGGIATLKWKIGKFKYSIDVRYNIEQERIELVVFMPDNQYFSIGFGGSMVDCDMIAWHANGQKSEVVDYWSTKRGDAPNVDAAQDLFYTTRFVPKQKQNSKDYDQVAFLTYRALDTGDVEEDFLIQLDQTMDMVWAIRMGDSDWMDHDFRGYFDLKIHQGLGNEVKLLPARPDDNKGLLKVVPASDDLDDSAVRGVTRELACLSNIWDDYILDTCYDAESQEMIFKVEVPNNSYLGIGFGADMTNTDMIVWEVYNGKGQVRDLYSKGKMKPTEDASSDVELVSTDYNSSFERMSFVTRRKLDTGDAEEDYVFALDEENVMCYAYKSDTKSFVKHSKWGIWSLQIDSQGKVGEAEINMTEFLRSDVIEQHGWAMWSTWFIVGLLLLVTKRYAKKNWLLMHYLHGFLGYLALITTIVFAYRVAQFEPFSSLHNGFGTVSLFVIIVCSLSGSLTAATMRFYNGDKAWSKEERVTKIGQIHRYAGYLALFVSNAAIITGTGKYFNGRLMGDDRAILGILSMLIFLVIVGILEAVYRIRNAFSTRQIQTPDITTPEVKIKTYTPEMIDTKVTEGKRLVLFDNLVLDLQGYERNHPGGKFNLTHNYGRDVSKFFFGGYNLVNVPGKKPYTHSRASLDIVEKLVVGVIKGQEDVKEELFTITAKYQISSNTTTFTFTSIDNEPVVNLKQWYNDPQMIGRHFQVNSVRDPNVKRQYTICSAYNPTVQQELLTMAEQIVSGKSLKFNTKLLKGSDVNNINLTVKTYQSKYGLATKMHDVRLDQESQKGAHYFSTDNAFIIKGPVGKGLQIQSTGLHVAFCGGTGALVFLDIIAQMLLKHCFEADSRKVPEDLQFYEEGFQLLIYASFKDKENALGLELMKALEAVNAKLGLANFKAVVRLSQVEEGKTKLPRWSQTYVEQELIPYAGDIKKIWVCGPPTANEMMDKTLDSLSEKLMLENNQIHIL